MANADDGDLLHDGDLVLVAGPDHHHLQSFGDGSGSSRGPLGRGGRGGPRMVGVGLYQLWRGVGPGGPGGPGAAVAAIWVSHIDIL